MVPKKDLIIRLKLETTDQMESSNAKMRVFVLLDTFEAEKTDFFSEQEKYHYRLLMKLELIWKADKKFPKKKQITHFW